MFGRVTPAHAQHGDYLLGTAGLSVSKILENMEIGHNILHGQWDWMRDPKIHSTTWQWDHASPPEQWQRAHNQVHHRYTNIIGKDNDLGYGIMRVDEDQRWVPMHLGQPLWNFLNACFFEYGIAAYDLEVARTHAGLMAHTRRSGRPRGAHDLLIAATALTRGRTVVSADPAGFADLPGVSLRLER